MRTTTMGLVLRATKTGEADRALLLLTPDGLVSAMGQEAEAQLRLLLNSLYLLSEGRRAPRLVKAVYELRAMTLAGFMPDLVACADCVKYEGGAFCFDARKGRLYCGECAAKREL